MKTKEFVRRVVELGFRIETTHANIEICDRNYTELATVRHDEMFGIVTGLNSYNEMPSETQHTLFNLLVEYASTPVEKRKEEYYIKHKYFTDKNGYLNYLDEGDDEPEEEKWFLSDIEPEIEIDELKFSFTLEELPDWVHEMIEDGYMAKEEVE